MALLALAMSSTGVPHLDTAFTLASNIAQHLENVKIYRENCRQLHKQCTRLLSTFQERVNGMESDVIRDAVSSLELTLDRIRKRMCDWSKLNIAQSIFRQSDIKTGIDNSYREIEQFMHEFNVTAAIDQSRHQKEMAMAMERDQDQLRSALQDLSRNIEQLHALIVQNKPHVPALMQSIQEELYEPDLPQTQGKGFRKMLWELHKGTDVLPPLIDLSGQIGDVSAQPVMYGGFSDIYNGMWLDREKVALKRHRYVNSSKSARKRIIREAEIWRRIQHDHILPLYGVAYDGEHVSLVSPWMENGNIIEYFRENPAASKILMLKEIAQGMEYLHEKQIVHGDLRGNNILVDANGHARIADFGVSKILEEVGRDSHSLSGSGPFRWMAAELIKPSLIDADYVTHNVETDIWAFGMVCLEVVTDARPFSNIATDAAVCQALAEGQRPQPPPDLQVDLWELMSKCWRPDPEERPTMPEAVHILSRLEKRQRRQTTTDRHNREDSYTTRPSHEVAGTPLIGSMRGSPQTRLSSLPLTEDPLRLSPRKLPVNIEPVYAIGAMSSTPPSSSPLSERQQSEAATPMPFNSRRRASTNTPRSFSATQAAPIIKSTQSENFISLPSVSAGSPPVIHLPPPVLPLPSPPSPHSTPRSMAPLQWTAEDISEENENSYFSSDSDIAQLSRTLMVPDNTERTQSRSPSGSEASSPPTKRQFRWPGIPRRRSSGNSSAPPAVHPTVFGKPLEEVVRYAGTQVPMIIPGRQPTYEYLPICVTKCGYWLKMHGLREVSLFTRESSDRAVARLQRTFERYPDYGQSLNMKGDYQVTDVARLLRKFLEELPEPVIPKAMYAEFIRLFSSDGPSDDHARMLRCGELIDSMPAPNRELLLYMCDLMSTFAQHSVPTSWRAQGPMRPTNMTPARDLVKVFQPSLLFHPDRNWWGGEPDRCCRVLEFMVERIRTLLDNRIERLAAMPPLPTG